MRTKKEGMGCIPAQKNKIRLLLLSEIAGRRRKGCDVKPKNNSSTDLFLYFFLCWFNIHLPQKKHDNNLMVRQRFKKKEKHILKMISSHLSIAKKSFYMLSSKKPFLMITLPCQTYKKNSIDEYSYQDEDKLLELWQEQTREKRMKQWEEYNNV